MSIVAQSHNTFQFDVALRAAADRAKRVYPTEQARIARGLEIALSGGVDLLPSGLAIVASQTHPGETYQVNGRCQCPDANTAPQSHCKHRWAKALYKAALADQKRALPPDRWYATYRGPDDAPVAGVAEFIPAKACWLFIPDDGRDPLYPAMQALSLGGHLPTAEAQRKHDGNLGTKFGLPQYPETVAAKAALAQCEARRLARQGGAA
jgi:hypothetical protein